MASHLCARGSVKAVQAYTGKVYLNHVKDLLELFWKKHSRFINERFYVDSFEVMLNEICQAFGLDIEKD